MKLISKYYPAAIPLLLYCILGIYLNRLLEFPLLNDFRGMAQLCLLMEEDIKYCVNNNWGFAFPLAVFSIAKVCGNLLVAERILSFTAGFISLLLLDSIMRTVFPVRSKLIRMLSMTLAALSPWYVESVISVHPDFISIAFVLAGFSLLKSDDLRLAPVAGFLVAMSYWFRFHFLFFCLLFPFLYFVFSEKEKKKKKIIYCLAAMFSGILVPHLLCYMAYGMASISNQKLVLAQLSEGFSWDISFSNSLMAASYNEVLSRINWLTVLNNFFTTIWSESTVTIFLVSCLALAIALSRKKKALSSKSKGKSAPQPAADMKQRWLISLLYIFVSTLPFLLLRGTTTQLESAFIIPAIPLLASLMESAFVNRVIKLSVLFVFAVACFFEVALQLKYYKNLNGYYARVFSDMEQTIPAEVLRNKPDEILAALDAYNKKDRYGLFSPVVTGGWQAYFIPFREKLGVYDGLNFHSPSEAEYIVLSPGQMQYVKQQSPELVSHFSLLSESNVDVILKVNR